MHTATSSASQYLIRFPEKIVACSQYALARLGVDRSRCLLKVDDFVLLCAPLQLGFRKAILMAALSAQELVHFQRYRNGIAGLSMEFALPNRTEPLKLFVRSTIAEIGQMKGRENVGLFIVDYKSTPDDLAVILGSYLEDQEKLGTQYEDYGQTLVKMTPEIAKVMGYNQYAVAADPSGNGRIQLFALSTKSIEYLEAASARERVPGAQLAYQLFFRKYRMTVQGVVLGTSRLPSGILKTRAALSFSPELVEIMDDYWFRNRVAARSIG